MIDVAPLSPKEKVCELVWPDASTENVTEPDVPPPGEGLVTVIFRVPGEAKAAAGITALKLVEFKNVVAVGVEPTCTTEP
jgi:hypothetical protein